MRGASLATAALSILLLCVLPHTARGQGVETIVVDTTADVVDCQGECQIGDLPGPDGLVSLREAVYAANATGGAQVIEFNIPITDPGYDGQTFTIRPQSVLDLVDDGTTLDGTTQPTFSNPYGPEIVLDGSQLIDDPGAGPGIGIWGSYNVVRGLVIHSFSYGAGVQFFHEGDPYASPIGNLVSDCYIGTDPTGTVAMPNGLEGVALNGRDNVVRNNVISGNSDFPGFEVNESGSNVIENNLIGTDRTGRASLGSVTGIGLAASAGTVIRGNLISGNFRGISLGDWQDPGDAFAPVVVEGNRIGTDITGEGPLGNASFGIVFARPGAGSLIYRNTIAFNGDVGVWVAGSVENTISENSIHSNDVNPWEFTLGIDLSDPGSPDGVTPNDLGDLDEGTNRLMNYPVLTRALATPGKLVIHGTLDTQDPQTALIELFISDGDSSGYGEGKVFLGNTSPNPAGRFTAVLDPVEPGTLLTATATDAAGNTSEFAANLMATAPGG